MRSQAANAQYGRWRLLDFGKNTRGVHTNLFVLVMLGQIVNSEEISN